MSSNPVFKNKKFKYLYGPVPSWRLGSSLGIDLLSQKEKVCTFDCLYCQLGATEFYENVRRVYVDGEEIVRELDILPEIPIDYMTFSGRGEPTLAANLGDVIDKVKSIRKEKVCVITNSSLMNREDVREELARADFVIAKLDASSQESFETMNRPVKGARFDDVVEGIRTFKENFPGKLALQVMFVDKNMQYARDIAEIARSIRPDEVQINTPLRACAVKPLTRETVSGIADIFGNARAVSLLFGGLKVVSVYDRKPRYVKSISDKATLKRRGKT